MLERHDEGRLDEDEIEGALTLLALRARTSPALGLLVVSL